MRKFKKMRDRVALRRQHRRIYLSLLLLLCGYVALWNFDAPDKSAEVADVDNKKPELAAIETKLVSDKGGYFYTKDRKSVV